MENFLVKVLRFTIGVIIRYLRHSQNILVSSRFLFNASCIWSCGPVVPTAIECLWPMEERVHVGTERDPLEHGCCQLLISDVPLDLMKKVDQPSRCEPLK